MFEKTYNNYRLRYRPLDEHHCQVTMYDDTQKWSLLWSSTMTIPQGQAAVQIFESIGYFDMLR